MNLLLWVAAENAAHIVDIGLLHADQQIVLRIVATGQLPGHVAGTGDSMHRQFLLGRRVDRIADFFPLDSSRDDVKRLLHSALFRQISYYKLGHWTLANYAVTHRKNPHHPVSVRHSQYSLCPLKRRNSFSHARIR